MVRNSIPLILILVFANSMPVQAHHSGVMYNTDKTVTLQGTVREFQWVNPHCWIQLTVAVGEHKGEWSIELGNPTQLFRAGWRPATLQAGQLVVLQVHPMRDGTFSGQFLSGTNEIGLPFGMADGKR